MSEPTATAAVFAPSDALVIDRIGSHGDGIARTAAGTVFVPFALPGETWIRTSAAAAAPAYQLASEPNPDRITPPCPHFQACGGCVAQHMAAPVYAAWKRGLVVEAFHQQGLDPAVAPLIAIAARSRRRATFTALRSGDSVLLGYHARASHDVLDIQACPVLAPAIEAALPHLRTLCAALLGRSGRKPVELRVVVTAARDGLDVAIAGLAQSPGTDARQRAVVAAEAARVQRLLVDGDVLVAGRPPVVSLGGVDVTLPDQSFLQAVAEAEVALRTHVMATVGDSWRKGDRIADLFCGLGTFTFALARLAPVFALDGDKAAIGALADAARRASGLKSIETRRRDLFREPLAPRELEDFKVVVLDPPRAGATAQAVALAQSKVPRVIMVSCNPGTLARDARTLVDGGYTLISVTPVDQFLYADHVEAVAVFER